MENKRIPSAASLLVLATLMSASTAHASGVTAGTLIQNTANASYSSGTSTTTVQSNTVTVKVDELLDVAVGSLNSAPVSASSSSAILSYRVTNTGNGDEAFKVTVDPAVSGNAFDGTITSIAIDSNGNGVYDAGVDTVIANGGSTGLLSPDGGMTVFVVVALPQGATDAQTSQIRLTAAASTGTGSPGTTFAGQGQGGGDAVVGATTAQANALGTVSASLATVSLVKSFTIADPFGGSQPVPGATVTFTIVASANGSGQVEGLHVTDGIPAGTTYVAGSLKLDTSALTDQSGDDAGIGSASGVDVTVGTLAGGAQRTVTFKTKIQ
ncbi:MAG: hypothetical protein ACKOUT_11875 [Novosphingobium sp.]